MHTGKHKDIARVLQIALPKNLNPYFSLQKLNLENSPGKPKLQSHSPYHGLKQVRNWWRRCQSSLQCNSSDEAGNWDSECLSTALIRSHNHILTPKWEIYWLWLAISKIAPLCSLIIYCLHMKFHSEYFSMEKGA